MILSELLRKLKDEEKLIEDTNVYKKGPNWLADWTTVVTHSITLAKQQIVYLTFYVEVIYGGGCGRVLWNGIPLVSTGNLDAPGGTAKTATRQIIFVADVGTHSFEFQLAGTRKSLDQIIVMKDIKICRFDFEDREELTADSGKITVLKGSTETVLFQNITPTSRTTCLGPLKETVIHLLVYPLDITPATDNAYSLMKNPGEADESYRVNWRLFVDDVEKGWDYRNNDYHANRENFDYGCGCYGLTVIPLTVGETHSIKITATNTFAEERDVRVYLVILSCPWILDKDAYEPIKLDLPPGSTIYVKMEPLWADPTKWIGLGCPRFISLGWDYYGSSEGTGILTFTFTFQEIPFEGLLLKTKGYSGCISMMAADVRG